MRRVWVSVATFTLGSGLALLAACGSTSGGGAGVYVTLGDATTDGQLAADATPVAGDAGGDDAALVDVPTVVDTAASDVPLEDAQAGTDAALAEVGPPDVPILPDSVIAADSGQIPCKSDVACKASKQVCDVAGGVCVDCNAQADCAGEQVCVAHQCVIQKACVSSKDCPFVCNKATGICVECVTTPDCNPGFSCGADFACHKQTSVCAPGTGQCLGAVYHACFSDGSGYDPNGLGCPSSSGACGTSGCSTTGCFINYNNGSNCNDGDSCTSNDVCKNGACAGINTCSDNNPCTQDACGPFGCQHTPMTCDDNNACTSDSCDKANGGCTHAQLTGTPCEDGNLCTTGETCGLGSCWNGTTINCDDKDACTADSCDSTIGCLHDPIPGCGTPVCGADPNNTCKGKCSTDPICSFGAAFCSMQPGICPPDWQVCCP